MRLLLAVLAAITATLVAAPGAMAADLIVRYAPGAPPVERLAAETVAGVRGVEPLPLRDAVVVRTLPGVDVAGALSRLSAHPAVAYAEPDAAVRRHAIPDDRLFDEQWAHPRIGSPAAWDTVTGGPETIVAVVDGGVELDHPDLRPNLWTNPRERPGNGRDDDRNGYVDDVHGYDFTARDGSPQDADGHGTHVAGVIAARGNDARGIAGVAWGASLLPLRVLDARGDGTVSDAIKGYGYALRAGARVVNVSWGGPTFTRAERDMIADAPNVLFVTSAGNDGRSNDETAAYPCNHDLPNVVCVGASGRDDALAPFSNFGPRTVDLVAPGVEVWSTFRGARWSMQSGTSMAAPHVAGAAALLATRAPGAAAGTLREVLLSSATRVDALSGRTATGGRLDVAGAVQAIGPFAASGATSIDRRPAADRSRPVVRVSASTAGGSRALARRGLTSRISCSEACALSVSLVARRGGRSTVLASRRARLDRAGTTGVRLRARSVRPGRALRATLRVRATDLAGNRRTVSRRLTFGG